MRVIELLKAHHLEGSLSSRELDERIELAFRARTLDELDLLHLGIGRRPMARSEAISSFGLAVERPARKRRSFLEQQALWAGAFLLFSLAVCALTRASALWYGATFVFSLLGFTWRIARGERRGGAGGRHSLLR